MEVVPGWFRKTSPLAMLGTEQHFLETINLSEIKLKLAIL
jgi:hypothetical protein